MSTFGFFPLPFSPMGSDGSGAPVACASGGAPPSTVSYNNPVGCLPAGMATGSGPYFKPFCEDFNEVTLCGSGTSNVNACANYFNSGTSTPTLTNASYGTIPYENGTGTSTTCGDGVVGPFEDCDGTSASNPPGCGTCTKTCRCPLL